MVNQNKGLLPRMGAWLKSAIWTGFEYSALSYGGYGGFNTYGNAYTAVDFAQEAGAPIDNSIIMACVNWLTTNFATAPLMVNRMAADGAKTPQFNHPLVLKLQRPNEYYPGSLLWDPTVYSFNVAGNAYWVKERNGAGRVVNLLYWPHDRVRCVSKNGEYISYYELWYNGRWNEEAKENIVHFRNGLNPADTRYGLSPIASALLEMAMDNEAGRYSFYILRNMGIPGAIITPDGDFKIDAPGAAALKSMYQSSFTGSRRGEVGVSSGPIKVIQPAFSPADINADSMRRKPGERIAALLGISPGVVGLGAGLDRNTYNNASEAYAAAYRNNLIPTQNMFADTLDVQLLPDFTTRSDETVDFDTSNIQELQEKEDSKVDRGVKLWSSGLAMLNEARAVAGLKPLGPEGDVFKAPTPSMFGDVAKSYRPPSIVTLPARKALPPAESKAASVARVQREFQKDVDAALRRLLQEAIDEVKD
jgi:HK97 family phage portal protein